MYNFTINDLQNYWLKCDFWTLKQAVVILNNGNPDEFRIFRNYFSDTAKIQRRNVLENIRNKIASLDHKQSEGTPGNNVIQQNNAIEESTEILDPEFWSVMNERISYINEAWLTNYSKLLKLAIQCVESKTLIPDRRAENIFRPYIILSWAKENQISLSSELEILYESEKRKIENLYFPGKLQPETILTESDQSFQKDKHTADIDEKAISLTVEGQRMPGRETSSPKSKVNIRRSTMHKFIVQGVAATIWTFHKDLNIHDLIDHKHFRESIKEVHKKNGIAYSNTTIIRWINECELSINPRSSND
ncbi:MAG: hypothetical protein P9L92_20785 [Candidatus Electryonea clarkiae]|nr:hypothetical protein [Candidatus Electryonea clarkiae]MDP8287253.1 hypothetical protein [Candidatus Electryonea clarkiae]